MATTFGFFGVLMWFVLSLVAADIATNKGLSGFMHFLASILLSPLVGLTAAIGSMPNHSELDERKIKTGNYQRCKFCLEVIKVKATCCKFCGKDKIKV